MDRSFHIALREWRGNLRQKEAAAKLKVSVRTYQNWEQGTNKPSWIIQAYVESVLKESVAVVSL